MMLFPCPRSRLGLRCAVHVLVILAFLAAYASAAVRNITIDDESGDDISGIKPNYTDAKGVSWKQNAHANSCEKELDATKAHNGSWHGLTPRGNSQQRHGRRHGARGEGSDDDDEAKITLEFFGTEIFVYFIVPGNVNCTSSRLSVRFELDDRGVGTFVNNATDRAFHFDVLVFSKNNLSPEWHKLEISNAGNASAVFFDYAVYSQNIPDTPYASLSFSPLNAATQTPATDGQSASTARSSTGIIVGSIVGGLAFGLLSAIASICYCRRRRRVGANDNKKSQQVNPYSWEYREIEGTKGNGAPADEMNSNVARVGAGVRVDEKRRSLFWDAPYASYTHRGSNASSASLPSEDELQRRPADVQSTITTLTYVTVPPDAVTQVAGTRSSVMRSSVRSEPQRVTGGEADADASSPRRT